MSDIQCYTCQGPAAFNGLGQAYCVGCGKTPESRCTCAKVNPWFRVGDQVLSEGRVQTVTETNGRWVKSGRYHLPVDDIKLVGRALYLQPEEEAAVRFWVKQQREQITRLGPGAEYAERIKSPHTFTALEALEAALAREK